MVEFVVEDHMCPDCTRRAVNPNQWVACVQVLHNLDHPGMHPSFRSLPCYHIGDRKRSVAQRGTALAVSVATLLLPSMRLLQY